MLAPPAEVSLKYPNALMAYATRMRSQFGHWTSVLPDLALLTRLTGREMRQPRQRLRSSRASARPLWATRSRSYIFSFCRFHVRRLVPPLLLRFGDLDPKLLHTFMQRGLLFVPRRLLCVALRGGDARLRLCGLNAAQRFEIRSSAADRCRLSCSISAWMSASSFGWRTEPP